MDGGALGELPGVPSMSPAAHSPSHRARAPYDEMNFLGLRERRRRLAGHGQHLRSCLSREIADDQQSRREVCHPFQGLPLSLSVMTRLSMSAIACRTRDIVVQVAGEREPLPRAFGVD